MPKAIANARINGTSQTDPYSLLNLKKKKKKVWKEEIGSAICSLKKQPNPR